MPVLFNILQKGTFQKNVPLGFGFCASFVLLHECNFLWIGINKPKETNRMSCYETETEDWTSVYYTVLWLGLGSPFPVRLMYKAMK
jgi:hypothetical protein